MSTRSSYLALAGCSILYFVPFLRALSHNGDEGTLITGAARVAAGQLPFRDFFEVMGPGTFYWLALFFKFLGTTWLATRISLLFTTLLITLVLFYLARRLRTGLEAIPVIFFVAVSFHSWNAVSHHMDSNLLGLLSFAALVTWMDRHRTVFLVLAGVGAGLTTWFMLPKGGLLIGSFVVLLWVLDRREPSFRSSLLALLSGYVSVVALVVVFFAVNGGLADLIYANLIWPLTNYSGTNRVPYGMEFKQLYWDSFNASFRPVSSPAVAAAISGFLSIPFVIAMGLPLLLALAVARWKRAAFDRLTLPYWIAGCAFWLSEMHRKDVAHIVFGSPLLIVLAFYYARMLRRRWMEHAVQLAGISAVLLCLLNPAVALFAQHKTETRRGTVYNAFGESPVLDFLNARIQPGEPVFIYPYSPLYYFLSAAENPTRHSILMYQINTEAQFREVVSALETRRVRFVVWDRSFPVWVKKWFPGYRVPPEDKLIIEPYLMEQYQVVGGSEGAYQFLERKDWTAASAR
jgi:hypothetical protein